MIPILVSYARTVVSAKFRNQNGGRFWGMLFQDGLQEIQTQSEPSQHHNKHQWRNTKGFSLSSHPGSPRRKRIWTSASCGKGVRLLFFLRRPHALDHT